MKSDTSSQTTTSSSSLSSPLTNNFVGRNFRELKKELKDIEKLSKNNLDIKTWASELKVWIRLQNIKDAELIFTACLLTSSGEPREIIEEMEKGSFLSEDEDSDSESEDESEDENEDTSYLSLEEIVDHLKVFYGLKENQTNLLRELRSMKIKRYEKVKDFNIRYRSLYHKLDKKRRRKISVLDYADSLANNHEAWKRVILKDHLSITKAFEIAEKVDRLHLKNSNEYYREFSKNTSNHFNNDKNKFVKKHSLDNVKHKKSKDTSIEDLTKKMKELKISACFFCREEGHLQPDCPKLNAILNKNRKEYFQNKYLNH